MNFEHKPQSRVIRCAFAAAAVAMTLALGSFIDGLARHYEGENSQLAQKNIMVVRR